MEVSQELAGKIESLPLRSEAVITYYKAMAGSPRKDVIEMIKHYPIWEQKELTVSEIGRLDWYLDDNPKHISHVLTDGGKYRKVLDVAKTYIANKDEFLKIWEGSSKVQEMVEDLRNGKNLPAVIIIPGAKYPNSPESSFIDGIHRSLALMVYSLETGDRQAKIKGFIGKKASLVKRALRRVVK